MKKMVLFISEVFGSGHTKVAEALEQSIALIDPTIRAQVIEPGMALHPVTTSIFLYSYKKLITRYPHLWRIIYQSKEDRPMPKWFQFTVYQLFHRELNTYMEQYEPDLVVCTHPFSSSSIAHLKRTGKKIRLCTVVTDFHAHRSYVHPEVDLYIVAEDEVAQQLIEMGVKRERITVSGIPTRPHFWQNKTKLEARASLQMKALPTVLVMGGGFGLGGIKEVSHALLKWKDNIQILICTGSNGPLRTSLMNHPDFQHPNIKITGFVDHIDVMFDSADLIITKPGGVTCFEALTKGIPMLLYQPVPGHEEHNCDYLVKLHLANKLDRIQDLDMWMNKLLSDPDAFTDWIHRIKQFQKNMNPLDGANSIVQLLHHS